ncbi:hypothetical protein Tsubulata_004742 [Turnera subulata]|uniref:3-beta hydroxysteroid dehydrogenase/isomerase domain-containing protein n=1 Tax=Turnera subulata TaxID=218843 RepID=A0A9Q0J7S7_9ROSI|nr:hypothetical protein Tsubulata_004742 [Turnera subulata]
MGFIETEERKNMEIEEFKRTVLLACAGLSRRKDDEEFKGLHASSKEMDDDYGEEKLVCVTSGLSFLGLAIVNRLLVRGYSVRIIVDNPDDIEKLRELETSGQIMTGNNCVRAVMAKLCEEESLCEAFQGCRGVFHTSAFTDPAGLSGYTKSMAEIEVKACENVIKACSRTCSVRNIVLTSSLLACVWHDSSNNLSPVINHQSWSDESVCIDKKLWYALGKLKTEKAAWTMAKDKGLKLVTICGGLVTGPEFYRRNPTATLAYLKGAPDMYKNGLLATIDVMKLADAHASVFQAMNKTAFGRYICYDRVIESEYQAEKLAMQIGVPVNKISGNEPENVQARFELSDKKLRTLMARTCRNCYYES